MSARPGKKQPNWILRGMIAISLVVHVFIFLHIAGIYRSESLTVIELTVRDSGPVRRSIPQPRPRHKTLKVNDPQKVAVNEQHVPQINMDPIEKESTDSITESIGVPDTSGLSGDVAEWSPSEPADYMSKGDYFDLLRLRIESKKEYPERARRRQMEGRVVVGFTLTPEGRVDSTEVVESSRHLSLDRAAVRAVEASDPFPRPPSRLFEGAIRMKITLVFELT